MFFKMGQNNSLPKPRRRSLRSPFLARRSHKTSLSHTFSLSQDDQTSEQLVNINLATEEELMTLSGISRDIAKCIVKHRQAIGRFRKIEDLALVAGIGAEKLDIIRSEVCIKTISCSSSRAPSVDSLKSIESRSSSKLIDVNKASVFELQCVPGMTQEMAANIVHHRTKKGPFKKLDDLLKVRSVSHLRFSNLSYHLTLNSMEDSYLSRTTSASEVLSNDCTNGNLAYNGVGTPMKHRKTSSAPVKLNIANGMPSPASLGDIFDLLSAYSYRPIPEEEFRYKRNGKDAIRIATWNLHEFTHEKAQNLGVKEVICRTILENRWSIVCVQEILEEEALQVICDELNSPRLRKVSEFRGNSHDWQCAVLDSQLAFIFDSSSGGIGVELLSLKQAVVEDSEAANAEFNVGPFDINLLNVNIPIDTDIELVEMKIKEIFNTTENLILLGDFTNLTGNTDQRRDIGGLQSVVPLQTNTGYASIKCKYSDNILICNHVKSYLTGTWSIVRQGLTHLAIPNGWTWGGPVSPHCPIWAEFYTVSATQNGF